MKPRKSFRQTLIEHVDKSAGPDGCWPWTGAKRKGYGLATQTVEYGPQEVRKRRRWRAHRAYLVFVEKKKVSDRSFVCQTCGNPPCCNPKHLVVAKSAWSHADTDVENIRASKLTGKQVSAILRNLQAKKVTKCEISDRFSLSEGTVRRMTVEIDTLQSHTHPSPYAKRLRVSIRKRGMAATAERLGVTMTRLRRRAYPLTPGQVYSAKRKRKG